MEEDKQTGQDLFQFDKSKKSKKGKNMGDDRKKKLFNDHNTEDLKRKREDKNVALRKEVKKNKFAKRRNYGGNNQTDAATVKSDVEQESYTVEQAEQLWQEGMDIMDYFQILAKTDFQLPHFIFLVELICSKEDHKLLFGVVGLRKLLSLIDNPPIQNVIDANLLPTLITLISRSDIPRIQFEVLWCLTNIASGKAEHVQALIDKGTIPIFISLLGSEHKNIVEQSIWALGNIAGEDSYYKALILKEGAIQPLGMILSKADENSMLARNCIWCITNLLRGKPLPGIDEIFYIIPLINECLKNNKRKEIVIDGMWALSYISDAGIKAIVKMIESGSLEPIIHNLAHDNNNVVLPAVRALGNIVTGEDTETQTVIEAGVLPFLHALLSHSDAAIRKETCWTLSNICAGTEMQVSMLIETGIIDKMIDLVNNDVYEIQREAGWSISNATALKCTPIIREIVHRKGLEAMCLVLKHKLDVKTCVVILEGIRNCLEVGAKEFLSQTGENLFALAVEECGGLDTIEDLQEHQNQHIYEVSVGIIESFFQLEEVDFEENQGDDMMLQF